MNDVVASPFNDALIAGSLPSLQCQPAVIAAAGERAFYRFLEFFTARIRNPHTRRSYGRAVGDFCAWLEARGLQPTRPRQNRLQPQHKATLCPLLPKTGRSLYG